MAGKGIEFGIRWVGGTNWGAGLSRACQVVKMQPDLVTDERLRGVLGELVRREPLFHRPEFGTARADFRP